jgi:hypothetical protein
MTIKVVALVLLCLMMGTAAAQEPKVTSLMSKDLPENPGREALMGGLDHQLRCGPLDKELSPNLGDGRDQAAAV